MNMYSSYGDFLHDLSESTGYEVFDERTNDTPLKLPYIVCGRVVSNTYYTDNKPLFSQTTTDILLFTYQKDASSNGQTMQAEKKVEQFLLDNGINGEAEYDWSTEDQLYETHYTVSIAFGYEQGDDIAV